MKPQAQKKQHKRVRIVLGGIILLLAAFWVLVIAPEISKIPHDFGQVLEVESYDNFYNQEGGVYMGEQQSIATLAYSTLSSEKGVRIIENIFDVKTLLGEQIFSVKRLYGIDALTGRHEAGFGDVDRNGYLLAPRMKGLRATEENKGDFYYWHVNYDAPILMRFRATEDVYGLSVYRYESAFSVDQTNELKNSLSLGDAQGIVLDGVITLWIEPSTGRIVNYKDSAEAFYYDLNTKERLYPWNKFNNTLSPESAVMLSKEAALQKQIEGLVMWGGLLSLLLLAILLFFAPLFKKYLEIWAPMLRIGRGRLLTPTLLSGLVIISFIALSFVARALTSQQVQADFEAEAESVHRTILDRLDVYVNVLRSGRGLIDASDNVTREEWTSYVENLAIQEQYPGIQGVGFAPVIRGESEKEVFEEKVRGEFDQFSIYPERLRSVYVPVYFLEPFDIRNQRAFGYDMFSESTRRAAMEYARDVGKPGMSGKVLLVQETETDPQAGFLIYHPVYGGGEEGSLEARRANVTGYVYAPFRMRNFMTGVFVDGGAGIGVEVYDGGDTELMRSENLMYQSSLANPGAKLRKVSTLEAYSHTWTISYTAPVGYGTNFFRDGIPAIMLVVGVLLGGFVFFVAYVITNRKERAIALARKMTSSLNQEKARSEAILTSLGEGLFVTDVNGKVLFVNKVFEKLTGYKEDYVRGKKIVDVLPVVNVKSGKTTKGKRPIERVLSSKRKITIPMHKNLGYLTKKGEVLPVSMVVSPVTNKNKVVGAVEVFRDVSHEQAVDKAKTEFVSLASHQLKTPLTSVNWYSELLLDEKGLNKQQREYAGSIQEAGLRMSELVNALLNVSRLELGTFVILPEEANLVLITKKIVKEQYPMIQERKQKFKLDIDKDIPMLKLDEQLISIVIQNLLSNASKYTPEKGDIRLALKLSGAGRKKHVSIVCQDSGIGIPEKQRGKIFQKLFRAENAQSLDVEGTGLGLYVVKEIADGSGCEIGFVSKKGGGTTFEFKIPISGMRAKKGTRTLTKRP